MIYSVVSLFSVTVSQFSMVLLCPPSFSLLLLFFYGKLSGGKYSCVCHVYAKKEQNGNVAMISDIVRNFTTIFFPI